MSPLNSLETNEEPQDWNPQETCYFCNSKTQSNVSARFLIFDLMRIADKGVAFGNATGYVKPNL